MNLTGVQPVGVEVPLLRVSPNGVYRWVETSPASVRVTAVEFTMSDPIHVVRSVSELVKATVLPLIRW